MSDLKPCPFCGAVPHLCRSMENGTFFHTHSCGVTGFATEAEAIAAWNRRAVVDLSRVERLSPNAQFRMPGGPLVAWSDLIAHLKTQGVEVAL